MMLGHSPKSFLARSLKEAHADFLSSESEERKSYYRGLAVGIIRGATCVGGLGRDDIGRLHEWIQGWKEPPDVESMIVPVRSLILIPTGGRVSARVKG